MQEILQDFAERGTPIPAQSINTSPWNCMISSWKLDISSYRGVTQNLNIHFDDEGGRGNRVKQGFHCD